MSCRTKPWPSRAPRQTKVWCEHQLHELGLYRYFINPIGLLPAGKCKPHVIGVMLVQSADGIHNIADEIRGSQICKFVNSPKLAISICFCIARLEFAHWPEASKHVVTARDPIDGNTIRLPKP